MKLGQNTRYSFVCRLPARIRQIHRDLLVWIDADRVEDHVAIAALHVERVQQVLHANVVRGERGRIIFRELGRSARDGADGVFVSRGVDEDDTVSILERLKKNKAARAAIETFNICGEGMLAQGPDDVNSYTFIAHNHVAEPQDQGFMSMAVSIYHFSPGRISIRPRSRRSYRVPRCSHDRSSGKCGR